MEMSTTSSSNDNQTTKLQILCQRIRNNDPSVLRLPLPINGKGGGDSFIPILFDDGAIEISKALSKNTTVVSIKFDYHNIGDRGSSALFTNLLLIGAAGDDDDEEQYEEEQQQHHHHHHPKLQRISLIGNRIANGGAKALGRSLLLASTAGASTHNNNTSNNDEEKRISIIKNDGGIFTSLSSSPLSSSSPPPHFLSSPLKEINLAMNNIGDLGVMMIAKGLKYDTTIQTLILRINKIGPTGGKALGQMLTTNKGLTTLNIMNNPCCGDKKTIQYIIQRGLRNNYYIENLDVGGYFRNDTSLYNEMNYYLVLNKIGRRLLKESNIQPMTYVQLITKRIPQQQIDNADDPRITRLDIMYYFVRENPTLLMQRKK